MKNKVYEALNAFSSLTSTNVVYCSLNIQRSASSCKITFKNEVIYEHSFSTFEDSFVKIKDVIQKLTSKNMVTRFETLYIIEKDKTERGLMLASNIDDFSKNLEAILNGAPNTQQSMFAYF